MAKTYHKSVRMSASQAARLAALAKATKRSESDVLRLLVDRASAGDEPTMVLDRQTQLWLSEQLETILGAEALAERV